MEYIDAPPPTPSDMSGVFISYRREDSAGHAGRLSDLLARQLGPHNLFMDVDAIQPGQDFARVIEDRIARCDVMLVIIGRDWLTCSGAGGARRLDDPEDFVRREIVAGLRRGMMIVPVLVGGARMPAAEQLPGDMAALTGRQAFELSDARFEPDTQALLDTVQRYLVQPISAMPALHGRRNALGGITAVVFGGGLLLGLLWMQHRKGSDPPVPDARVAPPADLTGNWVAQVPIDAQRHYTLRLQLQSVDERLLGSIEFPTGSGGLSEGRVEQDRVSFTTVHRPQFEDTDVKTRFEGRVTGDELDLVMQYADVVKRIRLRRQI